MKYPGIYNWGSLLKTANNQEPPLLTIVFLQISKDVLAKEIEDHFVPTIGYGMCVQGGRTPDLPYSFLCLP